jgi:hypothetical protein
MTGTARGEKDALYPRKDMILEVSSESIRDIAAAINAARKREPDLDILSQLERKVLGAIRDRTTTLELDEDQARSLRNVLLHRAYDQRRTSEGTDYSDLAERILRALETSDPPMTVRERE